MSPGYVIYCALPVYNQCTCKLIFISTCTFISIVHVSNKCMYMNKFTLYRFMNLSNLSYFWDSIIGIKEQKTNFERNRRII